MSGKQLLFFALQVIGLFFLFLVLMVWVLPIHNFILSMLVEPIMLTLYPQFIAAISAKNEVLEIVTNFSVIGQPQAQLGFEINPLKYTYGLPLFLALLLSSKTEWRNKIWFTMIAFFILLLAQTWSICFNITRHLLFEFQGVYAPYFAYGTLAKGLVSLGSQLGFLLFPTLIPIMLWVVLMPEFFKELTRDLPDHGEK